MIMLVGVKGSYAITTHCDLFYKTVRKYQGVPSHSSSKALCAEESLFPQLQDLGYLQSFFRDNLALNKSKNN